VDDLAGNSYTYPSKKRAKSGAAVMHMHNQQPGRLQYGTHHVHIIVSLFIKGANRIEALNMLTNLPQDIVLLALLWYTTVESS
jgi:hypothetical protein